MDTYLICVILFSASICVITLKQGWVLGIQFRTGYQNQAKSSLEQVRFLEDQWHTPTKVSVQYPPLLPQEEDTDCSLLNV